MRAIPTNYIKGNVVLGENIYNKEGAVLLKSGATINENMIRRINEQGIFTIYIQDEFSRQIEVDKIIDINIRIRGVNMIKDVFDNAMKGKPLDDNFKRLEQLYEDLIDDVVGARERQINYIDIKSVDNYHYGHALNVAILSTLLGIEMGVKATQLKSLFLGALLSDIGMMLVPQDRYAKQDKLTEMDESLVRQHPTYGYEYLKGSHFADTYVRNIALTHHERMDGTGYPSALDRDKLHLFSKIVALADVYDALTSDRHYKRAVAPNEAVEFIMGSAGTQFDFEIANHFCKKINPYPEGSLVQLNNGDIGLVVKVPKDLPLRPYLTIIKNIGHKTEFKDVDLSVTMNLVIVGPYY